MLIGGYEEIEWRKNIITEKMKHCYDIVKGFFVSGMTAPIGPGAPHSRGF